MPPSLPLVVDRILVGAAVVLPTIVFLKGAADPVNVPKLTLLVWCAALAAAVAAARAVRHRTIALPWGLPAATGALLVLAYGMSAAVAPQTATAVVGANGRNSGLLAYLAALGLFFVVLRAFDAASTKGIALALLLAGLFTTSYGLLQRLGVDAIAWNNPFNPIIASLGNPDFASAYLGITTPVAAWGALWRGWTPPWRVASSATGLLCLCTAALSSAVQGPIAAAAGLAVVALAVALDQKGQRRRVALATLALAAAAGGATIVAGAAHVGPARGFFQGIAWDARTWYWRAALTMWHRSPVTGVGLDSYGLYWRRDRPLDNPRAQGGDAYSDSAHSVPLQHLAQGGLLLALTYLLFVGLVAVALVRGLRRLEGQERLLLASLGGAWLAYQVQSLVSIDQVPLLLLDYVLGAAVLVTAGAVPLRTVRLPGALATETAGKGRKPRTPRSRPLSGVDVTLLSGIAVLAAAALWWSSAPLRASTAAYDGDVAQSRGDGATAVAHYQHAMELEPGLGLYRTRLGQTYNLGNRPADAQREFASAFAVDAAEINAGRTAGRLAATAGDLATARRLFTRAVELDPYNSATLLDWAEFELANGGAMAVRTRLQQGVRDLPQDAGLWAALGDARAALKDVRGAREAYGMALALKPGQPEAVAGLGKLDAAGG